MQNAAQAYFQTQVSTTSQGEIVVLLYDGALRFLAQAREKMLEKDYAAKGILISRTLDIVNELDSCLNLEVGGDLAQNLHQLYFMCCTRLLQANLKLDVELLDSVVGILEGLKSAFEQILTMPEAQAVAQKMSARQQNQQVSNQARPLSQPAAPTTARTVAAGAYQNAVPNPAQNIVPAQSVTPVPGTPARPAAPKPPLAPAAKLTAAPLHAVSLTSPSSVAPLSAPEVPTATNSPAAPEQPATAPLAPAARQSGFAAKGMAAYGKLLQKA